MKPTDALAQNGFYKQVEQKFTNANGEVTETNEIWGHISGANTQVMVSQGKEQVAVFTKDGNTLFAASKYLYANPESLAAILRELFA